jgi:hypothetical protein
LEDLTPKQQTILIARLADPSVSDVDIAEMAGCAESYPGQVVDRYDKLLEQLGARVSAGEAPKSIIKKELSTDDIATLADHDLLGELPVNIEAIHSTTNSQSSGSNSKTDTVETVIPDNQDEPIEREYDPSRWGSPVEHSTSLQAAPESPIKTNNDVEATPPQETQTDGGSGEFEPVKINRESTADDETGAEAKIDRSGGIPPEEIKKLKRSVGFVRETIEKAEKDEDEYARSIALQVEQRCYQLLQSEF